MARIEKTVFISYRRKDISWALAVYQYLTGQKYDVFFDFSSLSSGDFEEVIVSNIRARAHFVLILTPTALDRTGEPGDWLRREIETAIDEKRNIIPLFFDGFNFGSPSVAEKLTGKLSAIQRYNGLDIPSGYFMEAMQRLRSRYLNVPLNAVIHPVSTEVRKVVKEEQVAADKALEQKKEVIDELVKPIGKEPSKPKQDKEKKVTVSSSSFRRGISGEVRMLRLRPFSIGAGLLILAMLGIVGVYSLIQDAVSISPPMPTIAPPPNPTMGSTWVQTIDGMTMVYVPAGDFTMGSDSGEADEKPVHTVNLNAFWIDKTEVTNAMYAKCFQGGGCNEPSDTTSYADSNYASHPVGYVTWEDANNYCSWAERKLPTEAQWEKAASWDEVNQTKNVYPWGDVIDCSFANYFDGQNNCVGGTTAVGSYPTGASIYGALDMAGNVWEWVADRYSDTYYKSSPLSNPLGPDSGSLRVLRGGSYYYEVNIVRSAYRFKFDPTITYDNFGFRCVLSINP